MIALDPCLFLTFCLALRCWDLLSPPKSLWHSWRGEVAAGLAVTLWTAASGNGVLTELSAALFGVLPSNSLSLQITYWSSSINLWQTLRELCWDPETTKPFNTGKWDWSNWDVPSLCGLRMCVHRGFSLTPSFCLFPYRGKSQVALKIIKNVGKYREAARLEINVLKKIKEKDKENKL